MTITLIVACIRGTILEGYFFYILPGNERCFSLLVYAQRAHCIYYTQYKRHCSIHLNSIQCLMCDREK
jgi:hypothetical protein